MSDDHCSDSEVILSTQLLQNMQQFVGEDFEKAVKKLPKPKKGH